MTLMSGLENYVLAGFLMEGKSKESEIEKVRKREKREKERERKVNKKMIKPINLSTNE